jgi:hypothetical protein
MSAQDRVNEAWKEDKLIRSLSQHAYASMKDGATMAETLSLLMELNSNTDNPVSQKDLENIVKEAEKKTSKFRKKETDQSIEATFIQTPEHVFEQTVRMAKDNKLILKLVANSTNGANGAVETCFCKYDPSNDTWENIETVTIGDKIYKPMGGELFDDENTVLIFPSGVMEYGTDKELIEEIREFIHTYLEVDPYYEQVLPFYALFTWVQDKFPFTAYLHFVGVTSTGKSRAIDTMAQICYKSIVASGSVTNSPIFRLSDMVRGTLCLNEFELGAKTEEGYNEKLQILKSGSEHYAALRTEGEGKKQVRKYILKGPKIFGGQRPIEDSALLSRTIVIPMKKKTRRIPIYTLKSFQEKGDILRKKLLLWRLRHLNKINLEEIEYGIPELEKFDSRVQQIMTPIYYIASDAVKQTMIEYLQELEDDIKESRREEPSGKIFLVIKEIIESGRRPILKEVASAVFMTPEKTRNVVVKEMGLKISQEGHANIRYIQCGDKEARRLSEYVGVEYKGISVQTVLTDSTVADAESSALQQPS